jgi:hypothetical protein
VAHRLTQSDTEILKMINDCQTLTMKQLIAWRWKSPNPAYTRIRKLVDAGYLHEEFVSVVAAAPIAATRIFTITPQAATVLINQYDYDEKQISYLTPQLKNFKTLQTVIATNNFRVALYKALADQEEYELVEWRNEAGFRAKPIYVHARDGETIKRKPLYPDGLFIVRNVKSISINFLEADNATETHAQLRSQLHIYQAYISSGMHKELFNANSLNVLIVTTSEKRKKQLMSIAAQVGGGKRYRFTTYDQTISENILIAPIWHRIGEDEPIKLM